MLFYEFKLKCTYDESRGLVAAFERSHSRGVSELCDINNVLGAGIHEGNAVVIYRGNLKEWMAVAAFRAEKKATPSMLEKYLMKDIEEMGGITGVEVSALREITVKVFMDAVEQADRMNYIGHAGHTILHCSDLDFYDNRQFKLSEEILEGRKLTKAQALKKAQGLMPDTSLFEELDRIYAADNEKKFYGHPVHYKIEAGSRKAAMGIIETITAGLYSNGRLLGRRISLVSDITENCYDEDDLRNVFKQSYGATVLVELRGSREEHANYASAYEEVTRFISELVREFHRDVLCVFIEYVDNPGFTPSLMSKVEEDIDLISVREGVGNRQQAEQYLRKLVGNGVFNVLTEEEIQEALSEKTSFHASELFAIFDRFYKEGLKDKVYPAYKAVKKVKVPQKIKRGSAYERLQQMVGLTEIKHVVDEIIAAYKMQKLRSSMGLSMNQSTRHMIFTGNPGSAKTTVARLLSDILSAEGILPSGKFIECGRQDLVGKFVGWTAPMVERKFRAARGGILFIDEAYSLVDDRGGSFGDEAINAIVQQMENNRDDTIVIFAGYPEKMKHFLDRNEGLRSRIAFHLDFPDYKEDELTKILALMAEDRGYTMAEGALEHCREIFRGACAQKEFGNGRFARNLLEQAAMKQAQRLMKEKAGEELDRESVMLLEAEDFDVNAGKKYRKVTKSIGFTKE